MLLYPRWNPVPCAVHQPSSVAYVKVIDVVGMPKSLCCLTCTWVVRRAAACLLLHQILWTYVQKSSCRQWYGFESQAAACCVLNYPVRLTPVTDLAITTVFAVKPSLFPQPLQYHHLFCILFIVLQDSLLPAGPEPTMNSHMMCRGQNAFRVVPFEAPEAALSGPLIKVCQLLLCQEAEHEGLGARGVGNLKGRGGRGRGRLVEIRKDGGRCLRCRGLSCTKPWSGLLLCKYLWMINSLLLSPGHLGYRQHVTDS